MIIMIIIILIIIKSHCYTRYWRPRVLRLFAVHQDRFSLCFSHIPLCVTLFVSGCVSAAEGGERDMCVSQQPYWSGIEERAAWHTANRSTTCQFIHTVTTPPCRHITGKPPTITGCCRYYSFKRRNEQFFKHSVVFDPPCQVYDLKCCCVRLMLLCGFISPWPESDRTRRGWQNISRFDRYSFKKKLQQLRAINTSHVCSRQARRNSQTKAYRSLKAHCSSSIFTYRFSWCIVVIRCQSVWLIVYV